MPSCATVTPDREVMTCGMHAGGFRYPGAIAREKARRNKGPGSRLPGMTAEHCFTPAFIAYVCSAAGNARPRTSAA